MAVDEKFTIRNVCVFAASSSAINKVYMDAAAQLGAVLARHQWRLIYGGGRNGLMGTLARAVHAHGGQVTGVIPGQLRGFELAYEGCDELIETENLYKRKALMEDRADAFIALPGGFGTLDETFEVLTLRQLWYHQKPMVFLNVNGIYDGLIQFLETLIKAKFISPDHRFLYHVSVDAEDAAAYLAAYEPKPPHAKWF
jgi:cytokinin riboside 5'-monophosphate phosphoribohydrolase